MSRRGEERERASGRLKEGGREARDPGGGVGGGGGGGGERDGWREGGREDRRGEGEK